MSQITKVLTVVNSLSMGGIENTLLSCLPHFDPQKVEMTICCFRKGGVLEKDFIKAGAKIIYLKKTGLIFLDFLQMMVEINRGKYHVVHSRFGFTSGGFVLAARILKRKAIVSVHSNQPSNLQSYRSNRLLYFLLSFHLSIHKLITLQFASKILGHSKSNLDNFYKNWRADNKFMLVSNGIDFSRFSPSFSKTHPLENFTAEKSFTLLHIGSFRPEKNHLFLVRVFSKLLKTHPHVKLVLVGVGKLQDDIKKEVQSLGISASVYFAGFDADIKKYFEIADLFVMPSLWEGFGNVLIEAQYNLLPICVSKIPPFRESGYSDYHSYYFDPTSEKDFLEKLELSIAAVQQNIFAETVLDAKKFSENFSIEKMARTLQRIYLE